MDEARHPSRVDVAFPLCGSAVPVDHGHALFGAICGVVGDLHGARWLAVHPLAGLPRADGKLALKSRGAQLRLRVAPAEIPQVLPLAGKTLEVRGHRLHVGAPSVYMLREADALVSRLVAIKGFTDEEPFREAVRRKLDLLGVSAVVTLGRRRVLAIHGRRVVGFGVRLTELSGAESITVQEAEIWGRQHMGCGVFVPWSKGA